MQQTTQPSKFKLLIATFISTFGFIGLIRFSAGTLGSIAALPFGLMLVHVARYLSDFECLNFLSPIAAEKDIILIFTVQFIAIIVLFIIGVIASDYYAKVMHRPDPKEVVIDEVVGQLMTTNLSCLGYLFISYSAIGDKLGQDNTMWIFLVFLPFFLFRLFDVFKPWPINILDEKVKGGFGIMIDDVAAAIFAAVSYYVIIFILLDWYG